MFEAIEAAVRPQIQRKLKEFLSEALAEHALGRLSEARNMGEVERVLLKYLPPEGAEQVLYEVIGAFVHGASGGRFAIRRVGAVGRPKGKPRPAPLPGTNVVGFPRRS